MNAIEVKVVGMRSVSFRSVTDDGRLRLALAAFELERTDDLVALYVPVGSPGFHRVGRTGGPRGSFLIPDGWEPGMQPTAWRNLDVVIVHRFDEEWSTWRWLDHDREWTPGAYVNLERQWEIGDDHYDSDDLVLDILVSADGALTYKDEHELAWAESEGMYSHEKVQRIRAIGERAMQHFSTDAWPVTEDWERWRPLADAGLPKLPGSWAYGADDLQPAPGTGASVT